MGRLLRRWGGAVLVASLLLAVPCQAAAAPFRVTLPRQHTGTVADRLPSWTFEAAEVPAGFAVATSTATGPTIILRDENLVNVVVTVGGSPDVDVFTPLAPTTPQPIAPEGATVAADGSWTLDGAMHEWGRYVPGSDQRLWIQGTISIYEQDGDVRTATPEQAAAIAAVRASFEPSVRAWYGLDPLTTSDDGRAAAAAVRQALRRTADLRDWSAATDEQAFVARPGPQQIHSVYAAREGAGRLAVSAAYVHAPADIRRIHVPGMSWDYRPAGRCWLAHRDVGPAPLPVSERTIVHWGPMGLPFLGGPRGWPVGQFALTATFLSTYDLTAKPPLSLGRRGTRYELYFYSGFRIRLIVDVDRSGIARVVKEEQLDAQGKLVERSRIGVTTPAPRALLTHGPSCG